MSPSKRYGIIGIFAPILFAATYLIMSGLRPEYSHLHKAISELGSLDAPNKWWWNIIGYCITGILISIFAIGLSKNVNPKRNGKLPFWGLFLSGLFMILAVILTIEPLQQ